MRGGKLKVINDTISSFTPEGVDLTQPGKRDFETVILCTGFKPRLEEFRPSEVEALEMKRHLGYHFPTTDDCCRTVDHEDLYFIGFDQALTSGRALGLRWVEGRKKQIVDTLGTFFSQLRQKELTRQ